MTVAAVCDVVGIGGGSAGLYCRGPEIGTSLLAVSLDRRDISLSGRPVAANFWSTWHLDARASVVLTLTFGCLSRTPVCATSIPSGSIVVVAPR